MAKLYFRYGTVNCGKSATILQVAHNYTERGKTALLLKPKIDTKGNNHVTSRIGISKAVDILIETDDDIRQLIAQTRPKNIDCVLIDEVQFLTPEQIDQLLLVAVKDAIPVICYGLRTDFKTQGFPGSTRLLQVAHSIEEIKTICRCGIKATYNARSVNGSFTNQGDQIAIDGQYDVTYESLCPSCYFLLVSK